MLSIVPLISALCALFSVSFAGNIYFAAKPSSIGLPQSASLTEKDVPVLNRNLLGLSAEVPQHWTGTSDILSRPKALAIVSVSGVNTLSLPSNEAVCTLNGEVSNPMDGVSEVLEKTFGKDGYQWLEASFGKISGTEMAAQAEKATSKEIKTAVLPLRSEIEAIYKIANSLTKSGAQLSSSPALFMIRVEGLRSAALVSLKEYENGLQELQDAIGVLTEALSASFGDQALVEVITAEGADIVTPDLPYAEAKHNIHKREATGDSDMDEGKRIMGLRSKLNVYKFTSSDYPAIFAIFAGLIIILVLAVLFIAVGIWNMDPGKDSIIYRMTTTRMKKD